MPADLMIFRDPTRPRDAYKLTNQPHYLSPSAASVYRLEARNHGIDDQGRYYVKFADGHGFKRYKTEYIPIFWDTDVGKSLAFWIEERGGSGFGYGSKFVTTNQEDALLIFMEFS